MKAKDKEILSICRRRTNRMDCTWQQTISCTREWMQTRWITMLRQERWLLPSLTMLQPWMKLCLSTTVNLPTTSMTSWTRLPSTWTWHPNKTLMMCIRPKLRITQCSPCKACLVLLSSSPVPMTGKKNWSTPPSSKGCIEKQSRWMTSPVRCWTWRGGASCHRKLTLFQSKQSGMS